MKTLVVYDSLYGNTEEIARAIGDAITGDVKVLRAGEASPPISETFDLLIVGSPTHGGRPTQAIQDFTKKNPRSQWRPRSRVRHPTIDEARKNLRLRRRQDR